MELAEMEKCAKAVSNLCEREMVPYLSKAAVAAGCDSLFLEVHPRPEEALSDGPNALRLEDLESLLRVCIRIREAISVG